MSDCELSHEGRVIVVSGGVRGIGRALSQGFLGLGARVVAFHLGTEPSSQAAAETFLAENASAVSDGRLTVLRADVTAPGDRARVLQTALEAFGRLDVVINNAGVCYRTDLTPERLQEQEVINAAAPLAFAREAAQILRQNEHFSDKQPTRGAVLSMSSYVTEWEAHPSDYLRHYALSKRRLEDGMRALALALRPDDINVNVIAVGVVYAGMGLATIGRKEESLRAGELPVTKFADVDSVVFEALCMTHPRAHYKTGRVAVLDGGWNLGELPVPE